MTASIGPTVTSLQNRWVKYVRSLHRRKTRYDERAFLVEGVRLVRDALAGGAAPMLALVSEQARSPAVAELAEAIATAGARVVPATDSVIRAVSGTEAPQGIVAVFPFPQLPIEILPGERLLALVADSLRDPGNLGTLVRSALGAGVHALFVTPQTVDPFSPKVVRAGMGAHFRLPIRPMRWDAVDPLLERSVVRLVAARDGQITYDRVDWREAACLIIGSETAGASAAARAWATGTVAIPLAGDLESLNAGTAGSVILFEAARQRRTQELPPERG